MYNTLKNLIIFILLINSATAQNIINLGYPGVSLGDKRIAPDNQLASISGPLDKSLVSCSLRSPGYLEVEQIMWLPKQPTKKVFQVRYYYEGSWTIGNWCPNQSALIISPEQRLSWTIKN